MPTASPVASARTRSRPIISAAISEDSWPTSIALALAWWRKLCSAVDLSNPRSGTHRVTNEGNHDDQGVDSLSHIIHAACVKPISEADRAGEWVSATPQTTARRAHSAHIDHAGSREPQQLVKLELGASECATGLTECQDDLRHRCAADVLGGHICQLVDHSDKEKTGSVSAVHLQKKKGGERSHSKKSSKREGIRSSASRYSRPSTSHCRTTGGFHKSL